MSETPPPLPAIPDTLPPPRTAKPARPRSLACPNCGAAITVRATGSTVTAICPSCGTTLDVANEDVRTIAEAAARTREPLIPIGTRGTLDGIEWEAIGYQLRSSEQGSWQWEEWLLYNPYQGFRFLAQDHGHWTLYQVLRQSLPDTGPPGTTAEDPVQARTEYVLGEFYWRVKAGDTVDVQEFAAPPLIYSTERDGTERTWSQGTYLEPATVQAAFGLATIPPRSGRAPNQPLDPDHTLSRLWVTAAVAAVVLIVLQSVKFGFDRDHVVYRYTFQPTLADHGRVLASPLFTLPDRGGTVTLEVDAAAGRLDGLDVELALVDAAGTARHDAPMGISPRDGRFTASTTFASVRGGTYKLLAEEKFVTAADIGASNGFLRPTDPIDFTVQVRRHAPSFGYFWLAVLALLAWPGFVTARRGFQYARDGE